MWAIDGRYRRCLLIHEIGNKKEDVVSVALPRLGAAKNDVLYLLMFGAPAGEF